MTCQTPTHPQNWHLHLCWQFYWKDTQNEQHGKIWKVITLILGLQNLGENIHFTMWLGSKGINNNKKWILFCGTPCILLHIVPKHGQAGRQKHAFNHYSSNGSNYLAQRWSFGHLIWTFIFKFLKAEIYWNI